MRGFISSTAEILLFYSSAFSVGDKSSNLAHEVAVLVVSTIMPRLYLEIKPLRDIPYI